MIQALNLPKKVYFKAGCTPVALRELGEIYHCNRALLVTDPALYQAGIAVPVVDLLRRQDIRTAEFFTIGKRVSFADLTATLTAEQAKTCAMELLSHGARAFMDPNCTEFTDGMLTEAIAAVLKYTRYAVKGCPAAREKLHDAAALAGASYGNIVDKVTPYLPFFPTEEEVSVNDNDVRCAELAERLGFDSCRALFAACQAL